MNKSETWLKVILRCLAIAECCAVIGVVMPTDMMARITSLLGVGEFPSGVLTPYLARGLAAMYILHGGFVWIASRDVLTYRPFVAYLAWSGILFSIFITVIDIQAGFPWYWWVSEGPMLTGIGVVILALLRRL